MPDVLPPVAEPVALLFKINNSLVHRGLEGLSDDQAWQQLAETHQSMRAAFAALTADALAAPAPVSFAGAKTLAELLAFFAFHEGYHLGQVGYIRKQLGHSSLVG